MVASLVYSLMNDTHQDLRGGARFNVLLTQDRPHASEHWTSQFPLLMQPHGVASYLVRSGKQAIDLAGRMEIHAAVIDLGTPLEENEPFTLGGSPGQKGLWLLELFRRLPNRPPVVIVHNAAYTQRGVDRLLQEALRLGAFSVLNKPVELEQLLAVFRRLVDRQYRGTWPQMDQDPFW